VTRNVTSPRVIVPVPGAGEDVGGDPVAPVGGVAPFVVAPVALPLGSGGPDGPVVKNGVGDAGVGGGSLEHAESESVSVATKASGNERRGRRTVAGRYHACSRRPGGRAIGRC
jgi:hypothetical protein